MTEELTVGGWTAFHSLTSEEQQIFSEALRGFVGVKYAPTEVSTQLVNGTNYRYKCTASIPPSDVIWNAIVEIYKPINGQPHVTGITRI